MKTQLESALNTALIRHGIGPVSLPEDDLLRRRDEILLMSEVGDELEVVSKFYDAVQGAYESIVGRDPTQAVADDFAFLSYIKNQRQQAYLLMELRDRGYGKVVTVRLPDNSQRKYRVAQANASLLRSGDGTEFMVVNRLAPVAGWLVSAEVGDSLELPDHRGKVVDAEVVAIDLLDRSQECDAKDFSEIEFACEDIDDALKLRQLRASYSAWVERWREAGLLTEEHRDSALTTAEEAHELTAESIPEEISLGASFYTRTTRQQEELVRRFRGGLVIVEGIAGSGKTSVALGRLKVLHDSQFGYQEDGETVIDTFFAEKNKMVGFVRHAQLVDYLKDTIGGLELSGVPVKEFKELQYQLIRHRAQILQLRLSETRGGKYTRAPDSISSNEFEGRIEWLKVIEKEILQQYLRQIRDRLQASKDWFNEFTERETYFEAREVGIVEFASLMAVAWGKASREIEGFVEGFKSEPRYFALDRFMVRLKGVYDKIFDIVEDRSFWFLDSSRRWTKERPAGYHGAGFQPFRGENYGGRFGLQLKKIRDRFREQARRILHADSTDEGRWLPALADWYRSVLETENVMRAAPTDLIQSIKTRLDAKQLTNVDINLLLAITQIMSRGHEYLDSDQKRLVASLSAPRYFSSVFIDEVQDFYEIEVFLMASMANPDRGAVTVVGDFMQQLYAGTVKDLRACFPYAQPSELTPALLLENKRQAKNLAAFSSNLRHEIGDKTVALQVVPDNIPELKKETLSESDMGARIGEIIAKFPATKSIAVISPTSELAQQVEQAARPHLEAMFRETKFSTDNRDLVKRLYVHFTEPKPTKGLEFDVVIVTHFNKFNLEDPLEAHGAYVAVSRPRESLVLLNAG